MNENQKKDDDGFHELLAELVKYRDGRTLHVVVEKAILEFAEADRVLLHRLNLNLERLLSSVILPSGAAVEGDVA